MHHFAYRDGVLHAEEVNLASLAEAVGTPFYCYSTATLERHYRVFADAFADVPSLVCYAVKANSNQAVIATLARLGAGADVVSGGELKRALAAGVPPDKIMFSGIGKTAARAGARARREHSLHQRRIGAGAGAALDDRRRRRAAPPTCRCASIPTSMPRPTPRSRPAGPRTSSAFRSAARARSMRTPRSCRASASPASTCTSAARSPSSTPFDDAFALLSDFVRELRADGHSISHVDLGGGLGIPYREDNEPPPDPAAYAAVVKRATRGLGCKLIFEPGRLIVGNAGILVTRVLYLKRGEAKTFVIVDAAMNDLIRPTLYEAHHDIRPVAEPAPGARRTVADVVGPVCESGDFLALDRDVVEPRPGDLLAVMTAGAYGAVQAGTYNTRPLVPEVLVRDGEWALVRPRLEVDQLIGLDRLPPWL